MQSAQVDGDAKQKKSVVPPQANPGWVSQIQSDATPDPDLAKDPFAASVYRPSLSKSAAPLLLVDENRSSIQSVGTPPPAYALTSFKFPATRATSLLSPDPPLPPIPAVLVDKAPARTLSPVPYSDSIAPALASPTSFSFSSSSASQRVSIIAQGGHPNFPRHMNVVNDFFPTLPDELAVNVGEGVQLLDEYTDGWCMIRRVGSVQTETGVIPRCCLQDPPDVIPIERGMSSPGLSSQGGGSAARLMTLFA
jgi:hypothetical protein